MPKTRYDYEIQHESDVHKIKILEEETRRQDAVIKSLKSEIIILKSEAEYINEYINKLKNKDQSVLSNVYWTPDTTSHGAGRRIKLTDSVIKYIKKYRDEGRTQREIANMLKISIGLVNKACNMTDKP